MDASLASLFNLYIFSTGRRAFAQRQVRARAVARGLLELVAHIDVAIAHDRATQRLDLQWAARQGQRRPERSPEAQRIDRILDRTLTALRDGAASQAEVATPGDGVAEQVSAFLKQLFPAGLAAVTSLPYVEELDAAEGIVERLQGDLAATAAELGLARHAARLAQVTAEYRAVLTAPRGGVEFGAVREARARGQDLLLETVARIVGTYPQSSPEHAAARAELLGPILEQNEAIRQYLRARRSVEDVDPETGEVDADAPPSGPGADADETPEASPPS